MKHIQKIVITLALLGLFATPATANKSGWQPTDLNKKQRALFYGSKEDVLTKKVCVGRKTVSIECRDRLHYVHSNELHHYVWYKYTKNLGGGYVGVGSDQNFTFIAWARSRFVWLMDYDPVVVWINHIHKALVLHSATSKDYLALWETKNFKKARKIIQSAYKNHPKVSWMLKTHRKYARMLQKHFLRKIVKYRKKKWIPVDFSWVHREKDYQYIRTLFQKGRIRIMKGDLTKSLTLTGIGKASHALGVPVRIVYTSNAEQFWAYPAQFQKNMIGLNMDQKSIVLRTIFSKSYGSTLDRSWVYFIHEGKHFQKYLKKGYKNVRNFIRSRKFVSPGLFTIGKVPKHLPAYMYKKIKKKK